MRAHAIKDFYPCFQRDVFIDVFEHVKGTAACLSNHNAWREHQIYVVDVREWRAMLAVIPWTPERDEAYCLRQVLKRRLEQD